MLATTLLMASEHDNTNIIKEQLIYIPKPELPKTLYKNQIIKIRYSGIITTEFNKIETEFINFDNVEILTPYAPWETESQNKYYLEMYIKITGNRPKFPELSLTVYTDDGIGKETIPGDFKYAYNIADNKDYINIVAERFAVINHNIEKFDDENNILTLEVQGFMADVADINISYAKNQGYDKVENNYPESKLFYYAIIPNYMKNLTLATFEPKHGVFQKHDITLNLAGIGQKISTQMDLNPNKRSFPILQMIIVIFVLFFAMIILIKTRHWIFLAIIALLIGYSTWILFKEDHVIIKAQSSVYLLPVKNSTLFMVTERNMEVVKLKAKRDYVKIILPNKNIGWVKKENVRSN